MKFFIFFSFFLAQFALASGWICEGKGGDFYTNNIRVKLFNRIDSPRIPSILIISHDKWGTLLVAKENQIEKKITSLETSYQVRAENIEKISQAFSWEALEFNISHREGVDKPLKKGEKILGSLLLSREDENDILELSCERYLKN